MSTFKIQTFLVKGFSMADLVSAHYLLQITLILRLVYNIQQVFNLLHLNTYTDAQYSGEKCFCRVSCRIKTVTRLKLHWLHKNKKNYRVVTNLFQSERNPVQLKWKIGNLF